MEKWVEITGGINGEPKGLELDAFSPEKIRNIFVTSLKKIINPNVYGAFLKRSFTKYSILKALEPRIKKIVDDILKKEIDVSIKDIDLFELAKMGLNYIPVDKLGIIDEKKIEKLVLSYFK